jgi:tetratricopeptide (TPR) repeat protein
MDKNIFKEGKQKVERYVAEHRLRDAFNIARSLSEGVMSWELSQEIAGIEEGYRYMLDYVARGAEDPGRATMVTELEGKLLGVVDRLERLVLKVDDPSLYFNVLRYEEMQRDDTTASLLNAYGKMCTDNSLFNTIISGVHSEQTRKSMADRETVERRIFHHVWVSHPRTGADAEALADVITGDALPTYFRELMVWAVTLGGLHYFDARRVELLLDAYMTNDTRLSVAGLIGVALLMHRWRNRAMGKRVNDKLHAVMERDGWRDDLRTVTMELVKTIDTDRITRKIRDEVVPEMMKMRPKIDSKLKMNIENIDPAEMEENPEWQEMMEKSGLADKLKEMSEIQEEGGDVMMGTFEHLKTFPFFSEPANWFLPFHCDYSEFSGNDSGIMQPLAELMQASPFLCDSDKFSFMFSLKHVPAAQRDLMMQQFKAQGDQLAAIRAASLTVGNVDRKNLINKQVQNIYRFFKLFRRKCEFPNPFADGVNLVDVKAFEADILALDLLEVVGQYYFSHEYFRQALDTFKKLETVSTPGAEQFQKMGYATQKLGDTEGAVELYKKAEMLDSRSDWTLRRLARCLMLLHRPAEALERLKVLESRHPEHVATILNMGRCYVELQRYEEAIGAYYKAEYLDEKSGKALRPLAWCLLMTRDLERSRKYYEKVFAHFEPTQEDYLNMGHLALVEGNFKEALNFYSLNISARMNGDETHRTEAIDGFIADMKSDADYLKNVGVDAGLVPLLVDSLLYKI